MTTTATPVTVEYVDFATSLVHGPCGVVVEVHTVNASCTAWRVRTLTPGFERTAHTVRMNREQVLVFGREQAGRALTVQEAAARDTLVRAYFDECYEGSVS